MDANLNKGQQAILLAMIHPEPECGRDRREGPGHQRVDQRWPKDGRDLITQKNAEEKNYDDKAHRPREQSKKNRHRSRNRYTRVFSNRPGPKKATERSDDSTWERAKWKPTEKGLKPSITVPSSPRPTTVTSFRFLLGVPPTWDSPDIRTNFVSPLKLLPESIVTV